MLQELYVPILILVPAGIQVIYLLFIFSRFAFSSAKKSSAKVLPPVSVIVCGRNEEENFKSNLPHLFKQDYPEYEVVAVNDQSIDNSKDVLEEFQKHHSNLRLVNVQENDRFWNGKKFGLTLGIKASQYEHLLFIDADCIPSSNEWIREMASGFIPQGKEIVLGFGAYEKKKGFLNKLIRFETLHSAIQYFSWARWGMPYMGVGRNLAYTKSLFYAQRGFVPHMHIPMGDDDLFINGAGTSKNSTVVYTKDSFTVSTPKSHFKDWFVQKRRHIAVAKNYRGSHKFILGLYGATQVLFALSLIAAVFLNPPMWVWYGLGGRYLAQYLIFIFSAKKTGDWDLLLLLPFLEMFLLVNQVLILFANRFNKSYRWK
jgi:cellulose synthase/poly-beta-1,6-N-acetylglucosamine synthase-like glycosyltransferase